MEKPDIAIIRGRTRTTVLVPKELKEKYEEYLRFEQWYRQYERVQSR